VISVLVVLALATAGCGAIGPVSASDGDPAMGKALFIQTCGACHTLADAKTTGVVGPNLDEAFLPDKQQGFQQSTIIDVVRGQIAYAVSNTGQVDPNGGGSTPGMTPNLLVGQDAKDVAVYVAKCAGVPKCGVTAATLPNKS
jgi:mono/diheme cytochrome c family protein